MGLCQGKAGIKDFFELYFQFAQSTVQLLIQDGEDKSSAHEGEGPDDTSAGHGKSHKIQTIPLPSWNETSSPTSVSD